MSGGAMSPGWYDDPRGRHDHRYWDGERWTDQVANDGVTSVDDVNRVSAGSAAVGTATRAQRQAAQRTATRSPRKKWPWVLGGILTVFVLGIGGCAVLVGTAVNNAANELNAEQKAHAITPAQFNAVQLGATRTAVISELGKPPEDSQEFVTKGVVSQSAISSACIYYNKSGGNFGDRYQFCFTNDALDAKNAY